VAAISERKKETHMGKISGKVENVTFLLATFMRRRPMEGPTCPAEPHSGGCAGRGWHESCMFGWLPPSNFCPARGGLDGDKSSQGLRKTTPE
jgi:hypothetical protein